eukprot:SAG31_NODE_5341_length_2599_cov_1.845600_1_plen_43_part_10
MLVASNLDLPDAPFGVRDESFELRIERGVQSAISVAGQAANFF